MIIRPSTRLLASLLAGVVLCGGLMSVGSAQAKSKAKPPCDGPRTAFCDSTVEPPKAWHGRLFKLAQHYPTAAPKDAQPWLAFDPKTQSGDYLRSVLGYFYDGNLRGTEASFDPALNKKREWYNAPWSDFGKYGREPIHGLTFERVSQPGEMAPEETQRWNNYAVGFYNAPGGVTLGKTWADHGKPNAAAGIMPEGTVAAKLLFTTATQSQVPFLAGSPGWQVYVYSNHHLNDDVKAVDANGIVLPKQPPLTRAVTTVRLVQIDIAVKDRRAGKTGWIFGTFVYGGGPGGKPGSGWKHVEPVGVMWGNDPGYTGTGALQESWINPAVHMPHLGYQGRLNGPVDNPVSSCMSCHSTAETPGIGAMIPPSAPADPSRWFQNIPSGTPFDAGKTSLDYSLQQEVAFFNYQAAKTIRSLKGKAERDAAMKAHSPPSRAGAAAQ